MTAIDSILKEKYNKSIVSASNEELFLVILEYCKLQSESRNQNESKKKLYYFSSEFLIGKLLSNNLINLGLYDEVDKYLKINGHDIKVLEEMENEPSLGSGGLGRLAACFLDSIATKGLNGEGVGLLYHFGLFKQVFKNAKQTSEKDQWINSASLLEKKCDSFEVNFTDYSVTANLYQVNILGYKKGLVKLNLFDINLIDESLVKAHIKFDQTKIDKNLTLFLYPDDSTENGKLLRIYQQYFLVSAGAQMILKDALKKGSNLHDMDDYVVVQINDTHPSLIIPELIRLLITNNIDMASSIKIVSRTIAYTNHTILSEALEKWPIEYLSKVAIDLVEIIIYLDNYIKAKFNDSRVHIIKDGYVHMAHLAIHFGFSINGVAKLHTNILKTTELGDFYEIYPEKFSNKTNGITHRRWLLETNKELSDLLVEKIGSNFKSEASTLQEFLKFKNDDIVLNELEKIKQKHKNKLALYLFEKQGLIINENSIFDIQIKRMHEYKRQLMNALYIINKIIEIKNGIFPKTPISFFFGAKAAPSYVIAQDTIHLILVLSELIDCDKILNRYLKIVFLENYNVSLAQKLIPACDVSEQISLASKEASGTGNMKLMLNGAITIGTLDGANIEIEALVGADNIYIFGKTSQEVIAMNKNNTYKPEKFYENPEIKILVDFILSHEMVSLADECVLKRVSNYLKYEDNYMSLLDLEDYILTKNLLCNDFRNKKIWNKKQLVNIAMAGYFSSDRTIEEYNKDIWKLK